MGHAVYSTYSARNQNQLYAYPTIFTQEVASTTNELLYYSYKMENAADDEERLFYLEDMLSMFSGTFFTQMLYAEFEDYMYEVVESGAPLDPEDLSDKWVALFDEYRGDAVQMFPDARYQWSTIPHFYYTYYVYQYASSVAYAASIAERILTGEEGAVEDYLAFLKAGGSAAPADLLAIAGIDPLEEDTYAAALAFFANLVDEYEELVDAKVGA
jgi:oligoendopeptidase F